MRDYNVANRHERDERLGFEEDKHIYIYEGNRLQSVSMTIADYFSEFDSEYWSERVAKKRSCSQQLILEEWACKGCLSAEVGTYMHSQIERSLLGEAVEHTYPFIYTGTVYQQTEEVDISRELDYFYELIEAYPFAESEVYRTEWRVYDELSGIAGTIDCLLRTQSGQYIMVDWKRSDKIGKPKPNKYIFTPTRRAYGSKGLGLLSHLSDTSFIRYSLQQSFYAYILERHYGIKVSEMYLAVLSPSYDRPYLVRADDYRGEVSMIARSRE